MPRYVVQQTKAVSISQVDESSVERVIANYGESLLTDATEQQIEELKQRGFRVREISDDPSVKINCYRINTSMNAARSRALTAQPTSFERSENALSRVIVRMAGPMHPDWARKLESMGGKNYASVGNNSHLVGVPGNRLQELESQDFVVSVSEYAPQLKISEKLMTQAVHHAFPAAEALSLDGDLSEDVQAASPSRMSIQRRSPANAEPIANLRVVLFDGEDSDRAIAKLQSQNISVIDVEGDSLLVAARPDKLVSIAAIDEVRNVEPNTQRVLHNHIAVDVTRAATLHTTMGLDGTGQIIAVADTGLDTGDVNTLSQDFRSRTLALQALGRPGLANDPDGHGTHVAGSVLGSGANSNGTVRGMAPAAELVFQSVLDSSGNLGGLNNLENVYQNAFDEGARIHNNSWGFRFSNGSYNFDSRNTDAFAFEHRDFLIVFSAGNDAPSKVTSPGTAKNCLTVGASESLQTLPPTVNFPPSPDFPSGATLAGLTEEADSLNDIADFSCNGPAEMNRRKPDVVAPGSWILSARSTVMVADTGPDGLSDTGDEDGFPTHDEAVGLGLPGQPIMFSGSENTPPLPPGAGSNAEQLYMYQSGTSMAAPITTGCCALVRQRISSPGHQPSGALIKAIVVNGAQNIRSHVPSNDQGWGRVDLVQSLTQGNSPIQFDDDINKAVGAFQIRSFKADVSDTAEPVSVTLVWRDPADRTLQNKLHLRVFDGDDSTPIFSEQPNDILNNVQKVIIDSLSNSFIRIEVEGVEINRGIPELLPGLAQDFALVIGNATSLSLD